MKLHPWLLLVVACGSRSELDAPRVTSDADAARCAVVPARACEKLRVIGPVTLPAWGALVARADGFDVVGYPDGPAQRFAQRVVVGTSTLTLESEHAFFDPWWDHFDVVAVGDAVAMLDYASDAQDFTHAHFKIFDASYALRSDAEIDDGRHQCDWRALTCDAARCFAACWGDDGPRFVTFDVESGKIISGPNDDGFAFRGGAGSTVPLACHDTAMTFAANENAMFAHIGVQIFEVDDGPYAYEYEPDQPMPWPYDWDSAVWFSNDWTLKRIDRDANVTVIGVDAPVQVETFDATGATTIGLVRVGSIATSNQPETASTRFHAHVIRPDGSVTADVTFETRGDVTEAITAPIASGLAVVWLEEHEGTNTAKTAVIACADGP